MNSFTFTILPLDLRSLRLWSAISPLYHLLSGLSIIVIDFNGACLFILNDSELLTKSIYGMDNEAVDEQDTERKSLMSEMKLGISIFESFL